MLPSFLNIRRSRYRRTLTLGPTTSAMEERTLLSGASIYPLPAAVSVTRESVSPVAAPGNFQGMWNLNVSGNPAILGLQVYQTGTDITGHFLIDISGSVEIRETNGKAKGSKMTVSVSAEQNFTMKVKLLTEDSIAGKIKVQGAGKNSVTGGKIS